VSGCWWGAKPRPKDYACPRVKRSLVGRRWTDAEI
jgi:hypothetical protein